MKVGKAALSDIETTTSQRANTHLCYVGTTTTHTDHIAHVSDMLLRCAEFSTDLLYTFLCNADVTTRKLPFGFYPQSHSFSHYCSQIVAIDYDGNVGHFCTQLSFHYDKLVQQCLLLSSILTYTFLCRLRSVIPLI